MIAGLAAAPAAAVIRSGSARAADTPDAGAPPPGGFAHAIAMHGAPALGPDFRHVPYADPAAPMQGGIRIGERGAFDSLNPFTIRGRSHWTVREHLYESLLERSWDEPFTLYGLLADGVWTDDARSEVRFRLHPEARFSDGAPVTVEDVIFTLETLREKGKPNHRSYYGQVAAIERTGPREVRFVFAAPNRELPLLLGLMPILPAALWDGRDIAEPSLEVPVGSGPYQLEIVEDGRRLLYRRDPGYWGAGLALNAGRHNFETIEYQFFRDNAALWQAFTAGALDVYPDGDPAHWAEAYDFPAVADGRVLRTEIPHGRASGMEGFVFNARRAMFADRRVRVALAEAFDFAWVNERFFRGGYSRIESYFSGSSLGFRGAAEGGERALLAPYAAQLPEGTLEAGWRPPEGAGDGRNRKALRKAAKLLQDAGWTVRDGVLRNAAGEPFRFEILLGSSRDERIARAFVDAISPLGLQVEMRVVDQAQYQDRLNAFDYDMIVRRWYLSLSPGEEQRFYWGSAAASEPGSRNYMGVQDPVVDAMIDAMLAARTREAFEEAVRALDRALSSGVYVIPFGYLASDRLAHGAALKKPARDALYGHRPDVWWRES